MYHLFVLLTTANHPVRRLAPALTLTLTLTLIGAPRIRARDPFHLTRTLIWEDVLMIMVQRNVFTCLIIISFMATTNIVVRHP